MDKNYTAELSVQEADCAVCSNASGIMYLVCQALPPTAVLCHPRLVGIPNYKPIFLSVTTTFSSGVVSPPARVDTPLWGGVLSTPSLLYSQYRVPIEPSLMNHVNNSQAAVGFLGEYFSANDLQSFFSEFPAPISRPRRVDKVTGVNNESHPGLEGSLDIQYLMSTNGVRTEFWSVEGWLMDWMVQVANTSDSLLPSLIEISYGSQESSTTEADVVRMNVEV